jgi:ketopantoate hydroxymethyltransferase
VSLLEVGEGRQANRAPALDPTCTGERFVMVTCYDYQCARVFDDVGIPILLIGDTLGLMVLGYDTTIPVTMQWCITA